MKKIIVLILLFLTVTSTFAQKSSPRIFSREKQFDFKDVSSNKILKHTFVLINIGTSILKIKDVKSSCECTVTHPIKSELEPGDSTEITVEFTTNKKIGDQRHHVYIMSNDPQTPIYRLTILANIILSKNEEELLPTIKIPFTVYDFGDIKQGKSYSRDIEIKNIGKDLLKIKNIKAGCRFIKLKLKKKELAFNQTEKLNIKFNTNNLSGRQSCTIIIKSNDPHTRVAILTVFANVIK